MSLRHMLLGIIKDEPLSGYDLNKFFAHVIQYFWSADRSRIYRTLHQMHADGWVEIEYVAQDASPDKKVYHITEAGRAALRAWLTAPDEPQPSRVPWLGKLFFGSDLPPDELVALLERRIVALQAELDALESRSESSDALLAFIRNPNTPRRGRLGALTLDYGIAWGHFQIAWARRAIAALRAGDTVPFVGATPASPVPASPVPASPVPASPEPALPMPPLPDEVTSHWGEAGLPSDEAGLLSGDADHIPGEAGLPSGEAGLLSDEAGLPSGEAGLAPTWMYRTRSASDAWPQRRTIRLSGYDYRSEGACFVTMCTHDRAPLFGTVIEGEVALNPFGHAVFAAWHDLPMHHPHVVLDAFVVMPNHVHAILILDSPVGATPASPTASPVFASPMPAPPAPPKTPETPFQTPQGPRGPLLGSLGAVVGSFKSAVARRINQRRATPGSPVWQRNYYEHIIRDEDELNAIRLYIELNPVHWADDAENPAFS